MRSPDPILSQNVRGSASDSFFTRKGNQQHAAAHAADADRFFFKPVTPPESAVVQPGLTVNAPGDVTPLVQRSCGAPDIGDPRSECQGQSGLVVGNRFLFQVNCDELRRDTSPAQELALRSFIAGAITNGDRIDVHGFASEDGGSEYNDKLSCARAVRARDIIEQELLIQGISATVATYRHGEVPGDHERHRAVVLEVENGKPYTEDPSQVAFIPCSTSPRSLGSRGSCGSGTDFTFFDFPPLSTRDKILVSMYRPLSDTLLLTEMRGVLVALGGLEGNNATSRFAAGTGATHRFGPTHSMSAEAKGTATFGAVRSASRSALNAAITSQAASGVIDCNTLTMPVGTLPAISFPLSESVRLKTIIGGTQGLRLELVSIRVDPIAHTYEALVRFIICDDFGVDDHDLYAPGLIPFWVLQHERSGFRPYIHELVIEETFIDTF